MKKPQSVSRRKFLQTATTAAITSPLLMRSMAHANPLQKKLRHACIGVGGMGWHDFTTIRSHPNVEIVALCDVDANNLKKAAELHPNVPIYADWREMFAKEKENIDSVNVSVPDHNHFVIAMEAIRNNKHVYCQKPLCHDVQEVRLLTQAAIKKGVKTQLGTQIASSKGDRIGVQWIKEEAIGKIKHVYLCSNRPGIEAVRLLGPRPTGEKEVPAHLNWDLWIGTAPMRPFQPTVYHPGRWRTWQDFGTGWSGDIGCHIFDAVWKGMGLKAPLTVQAKVQKSWQDSPERRADTWPQSNHITWTFPGNKMTAEDKLTVEWFDGEFYPPDDVRALYSIKDYPVESAMLIGTKGALLIPHQGTPVLLPKNDFDQKKLPELAERDHYHHFVDACLGGENTESHFAQSGPMTEAIILGTVAIRVPGQLLQWDAAKMKFPNFPEANQYIGRKYRKGWEVKSV
jgi:predicted dehydrogenase